jgi:hypothetical protein
MNTVEAGPHRNGRRAMSNPGGDGSPAEDFDIRRLIRRHICSSPPASDPAAIAANVAEEVPEEQLRAVVARWLPAQVANELFNLNAERCKEGSADGGAWLRRRL